MKYAEFQKDHTNWPVRMADLKGRHVRLLREFVTCGGWHLPAKRVLVVTAVYRGCLHLDDLKGHIALRFVRPRNVELMPRRKER